MFIKIHPVTRNSRLFFTFSSKSLNVFSAYKKIYTAKPSICSIRLIEFAFITKFSIQVDDTSRRRGSFVVFCVIFKFKSNNFLGNSVSFSAIVSCLSILSLNNCPYFWIFSYNSSFMSEIHVNKQKLFSYSVSMIAENLLTPFPKNRDVKFLELHPLEAVFVDLLKQNLVFSVLKKTWTIFPLYNLKFNALKGLNSVVKRFYLNRLKVDYSQRFLVKTHFFTKLNMLEEITPVFFLIFNSLQFTLIVSSLVYSDLYKKSVQYLLKKAKIYPVYNSFKINKKKNSGLFDGFIYYSCLFETYLRVITQHLPTPRPPSLSKTKPLPFLPHLKPFLIYGSSFFSLIGSPLFLSGRGPANVISSKQGYLSYFSCRYWSFNLTNTIFSYPLLFDMANSSSLSPQAVDPNVWYLNFEDNCRYRFESLLPDYFFKKNLDINLLFNVFSMYSSNSKQQLERYKTFSNSLLFFTGSHRFEPFFMGFVPSSDFVSFVKKWEIRALHQTFNFFSSRKLNTYIRDHRYSILHTFRLVCYFSDVNAISSLTQSKYSVFKVTKFLEEVFICTVNLKVALHTAYVNEQTSLECVIDLQSQISYLLKTFSTYSIPYSDVIYVFNWHFFKCCNFIDQTILFDEFFLFWQHKPPIVTFSFFFQKTEVSLLTDQIVCECFQLFLNKINLNISFYGISFIYNLVGVFTSMYSIPNSKKLYKSTLTSSSYFQKFIFFPVFREGILQLLTLDRDKHFTFNFRVIDLIINSINLKIQLNTNLIEQIKGIIFNYFSSNLITDLFKSNYIEISAFSFSFELLQKIYKVVFFKQLTFNFLPFFLYTNISVLLQNFATLPLKFISMSLLSLKFYNFTCNVMLNNLLYKNSFTIRSLKRFRLIFWHLVSSVFAFFYFNFYFLLCCNTFSFKNSKQPTCLDFYIFGNFLTNIFARLPFQRLQSCLYGYLSINKYLSFKFGAISKMSKYSLKCSSLNSLESDTSFFHTATHLFHNYVSIKSYHLIGYFLLIKSVPFSLLGLKESLPVNLIYMNYIMAYSLLTAFSFSKKLSRSLFAPQNIFTYLFKLESLCGFLPYKRFQALQQKYVIKDILIICDHISVKFNSFFVAIKIVSSYILFLYKLLFLFISKKIQQNLYTDSQQLIKKSQTYTLESDFPKKPTVLSYFSCSLFYVPEQSYIKRSSELIILPLSGPLSSKLTTKFLQNFYLMLGVMCSYIYKKFNLNSNLIRLTTFSAFIRPECSIVSNVWNKTPLLTLKFNLLSLLNILPPLSKKNMCFTPHYVPLVKSYQLGLELSYTCSIFSLLSDYLETQSFISLPSLSNTLVSFINYKIQVFFYNIYLLLRINFITSNPNKSNIFKVPKIFYKNVCIVKFMLFKKYLVTFSVKSTFFKIDLNLFYKYYLVLPFNFLNIFSFKYSYLKCSSINFFKYQVIFTFSCPLFASFTLYNFLHQPIWGINIQNFLTKFKLLSSQNHIKVKIVFGACTGSTLLLFLSWVYIVDVRVNTVTCNNYDFFIFKYINIKNILKSFTEYHYSGLSGSNVLSIFSKLEIFYIKKLVLVEKQNWELFFCNFFDLDYILKTLHYTVKVSTRPSISNISFSLSDRCLPTSAKEPFTRFINVYEWVGFLDTHHVYFKYFPSPLNFLDFWNYENIDMIYLAQTKKPIDLFIKYPFYPKISTGVWGLKPFLALYKFSYHSILFFYVKNPICVRASLRFFRYFLIKNTNTTCLFRFSPFSIKNFTPVFNSLPLENILSLVDINTFLLKFPYFEFSYDVSFACRIVKTMIRLFGFDLSAVLSIILGKKLFFRRLYFLWLYTNNHFFKKKLISRSFLFKKHQLNYRSFRSTSSVWYQLNDTSCAVYLIKCWINKHRQISTINSMAFTSLDSHRGVFIRFYWSRNWHYIKYTNQWRGILRIKSTSSYFHKKFNLFTRNRLNYPTSHFTIKEATSFIKNSSITQEEVMLVYQNYDFIFCTVFNYLLSKDYTPNLTIFWYYCEYLSVLFLRLKDYHWYCIVSQLYNKYVLYENGFQALIFRHVIISFTDILEFEWPLIFINFLTKNVHPRFDIMGRFLKDFNPHPLMSICLKSTYFIKSDVTDPALITLLVVPKYWVYINLTIKCYYSFFTYVWDFLFFHRYNYTALLLILTNYMQRLNIRLLTQVVSTELSIQSLQSNYGCMVWLEREISEFSGIKFIGLKDSRRLLLNYSATLQDLYTKNNEIFVL